MDPHEHKHALTTRPNPVPYALPAADLQLYSVYRTAAERTLVVMGEVEAEIRYDASGWGERVLVNGELAGQSSGFAWSCKLIDVSPRIDFRLFGPEGWLPARVEVAMSWAFWRGLRDFRLVVADQVVYEERNRQIITPADPTSFKTGAGFA
jgi:hypothetical protein